MQPELRADSTAAKLLASSRAGTTRPLPSSEVAAGHCETSDQRREAGRSDPTKAGVLTQKAGLDPHDRLFTVKRATTHNQCCERHSKGEHVEEELPSGPKETQLNVILW